MTLTPCPYYSIICDERQLWKKCPVVSMENKGCTALSPHDIAFVRAAVLGRAVGREEVS